MSYFKIRTIGFTDRSDVFPLYKEKIDYFNITTVYSGSLHYVVDGKDYFLKKGDTFIIRPGSVRMRMSGNEPARYFAIDYWSDGVEEEGLPELIYNCDSYLKKNISFLDRTHKNRFSVYYDKKCSIAVHLFVLALREEMESIAVNEHVKKMLRYIDEHITGGIRLEDMAKECFLSPLYCSRLFKKEMKIPFREYLVRERVRIAVEYIKVGDVALKDIPFNCGFSDYGQFSNIFKRYMGMYPSKYKRLYDEGEIVLTEDIRFQNENR